MYNINENQRIARLAKQFKITYSTYLEYDSPKEFIKSVSQKPTNLSENYKLNVRYSLLSSFYALSERDVDKVLLKHNYNYCSSFSALDDIMKTRYGDKKRHIQHAARAKSQKFLNEKAFVLQAFFVLNKKEIIKRFKRFSCKICLEDNLYRKDMEGCKGDTTHLYCINCIKRYMENLIKNTKDRYKCMELTCNSYYSMKVIKKILEAKDVELIKKYRSETKAFRLSLGNPNFYKCPGCAYGKVINSSQILNPIGKKIPNNQNSVLECQNKQCGRKTCIFCKEDQHLPYSCIENRYLSPERANAYIKKKADQSIIRNCPKCGRIFHNLIVERESDQYPCNKATCVCGYQMCYLCRKELNKVTNNLGDSHFNNISGDFRCKLFMTRLEHQRYDEATYQRVLEYETDLYQDFLEKEKQKKRIQRKKEAKQLAKRKQQLLPNNVLETIDENAELKLDHKATQVNGRFSRIANFFRRIFGIKNKANEKETNLSNKKTNKRFN